MEEYKSVIIITPYVATVNQGGTFLEPLGQQEVEFIGLDVYSNLTSEEKHLSYTECMTSLKEKLINIQNSKGFKHDEQKDNS